MKTTIRPVIGVTSSTVDSNGGRDCNLNIDYVNAINQAGGIAIILPTDNDKEIIENHIRLIDGLVLSGGGDVSPLLYDEDPIHEIGSISLDRDKYEIDLFKMAFDMGLPIFGICRGMQLINIALGGSLFQDISRQIAGSLGHSNEKTSLKYPYHRVKIQKNSRLYEILETDSIIVNSFHHQSIKDIGEKLKVNANSYDGVVEGIETNTSNFLLGVQWHPEKLIRNSPVNLNIFKNFIKVCEKNLYDDL